MKFNVSSKTLYSYVSAVSKVINSKNALTILNNIMGGSMSSRLFQHIREEKGMSVDALFREVFKC